MAYCVKCRGKVAMTQVEAVKMKNGRHAYKGKCSDCGTGIYRIASASEVTPA